MTEVQIEHHRLLDAETLARRALAIALNARPGGDGPGARPLGDPDPVAAQRAVDVLRERTQPGPFLDLAIELLERSSSRHRV